MGTCQGGGALATKKFAFTGKLKQPDLWTAETPNLYWLTVELSNDKGEVLQRSEEMVGIREVRVEGTQLMVNNRPIKLKGICLNEIDPKVGRAFRHEDFRRRLLEMKRCHINFIRTAHYPFAPYFFELCDEMGFYVCCEVPFASGARSELGKATSAPALLDRATRTVLRDRNRPSVAIWSAGNENPYIESTVGPVLDRIRELDPSRPRTLPHARQLKISGPQDVETAKAFLKSVRGRIEIASIHYPSTKLIDSLVEVLNGELPLIQTEYAHAAGNGFGSFEWAIARMLADDRLIGGSIWAWHDQGMLLDDTEMSYYDRNGVWPSNTVARFNQPAKYQGVWTDPRHFIDTHGDAGTDGIVYANGYPKESWELVRKLYSPVVVTATNGELVVENRHAFVSLRGWKLKWTGGEAWLGAEPGKTERFACKCGGPFVEVSVYDPKGERVWETSFRGEGEAKKPYEIVARAPSPLPDERVKSLLSKMLLKVGREIGLCYLCKTTPKPKRKPKADEIQWAPYVIRPKVVAVRSTGERTFDATVRYYRGEDETSAEYFEAELKLKENRDGSYKVRYSLTASPAVDTFCAEIGFAFVAEGATRVDWDGNGPWTATSEKHQHSTPGIWSMAKESLFMPGNRSDVSWALASDGKRGIAITASSRDVSFECVDGRLVLSANGLVAGYGTKWGFGNGARSAKGLKLIGSFTYAEAEVIAPLPVVAPDRPFSSHYGW